MFWSKPSVRLLSGLALLAACAGPTLAGPRVPPRVSTLPNPAVRAQLENLQNALPFRISPRLLKGARLVTYPQILKETLADKSPAAQEVHTYLRDPAAWQRNMIKNHQYELGLPQLRLYLASGAIIRSWNRPLIAQGVQRYHAFTDIQPGYSRKLIWDPTHLYEIQTPPRVKPPVIVAWWPTSLAGWNVTIVINKKKIEIAKKK
jgi:hypothetical protein